ncbi:ATP-dependent DNA helicase RecQ [Verrucomicrobium sp. BvORR106]|uniref:RecQ family ATP-dependent DNA helicase n=1 Tax=Verrucomicrobium sp. BvORR106 TaxID=1403819 RepID=UPI0005703FB1|nr:ATP-dependent DNA helicase RecQ [Verrucomicrobium sp. BvORR106]
MGSELRTALKQYFGHDAFREGQEQVIEALLAGRSSLAVFPTGGGKSLCYQLPALLMDGLTLVISPLIALMKDQVEALRAKNIPAARLDSTLSGDEVAQVLGDMRSGRLKLLYIAPERLMSESFMERLSRVKISLLAIDESHCISEWGHNFRPEYLRLAEVARKLQLHPVLALTATATPGVAEDIRRTFRIAPEDHIQTTFLRRNLAIQITPAPVKQRLALLTQKLKEERHFPAIVYVTLQQTAEEVATYLGKAGVHARAYHAGLPDDHRNEVQDAFMSGGVDVIVATIAFGMGIDKADIRSVYHYNLPKSLENYQQEIGRAGRDGQGSHCEMLACADDLVVLQNFVYGDTPTPAALRQVVDHLLRQGHEFDISRYDLAHSTDIRPLVLETVLTYLELDQVLTPLGAFYSGYQVRFVHGEARLLSGHKPDRQEFLRKLFNSGKRGTRWVTLNVDESAAAIGETRERILKALTYLEESGDIECKPTGLRHRFRLCDDATKRDPGAICQRMQTLFAERERKDAGRLERVLELAVDPSCTTRHLLRYFGEEMPSDCGTCGNCRSSQAGSASLEPKVIPQSPVPSITVEHLQRIQELQRQGLAPLRAPRQLARFLCGISSPATSRARLTKHDAFAMLERVPFKQVLEQAESLGG